MNSFMNGLTIKEAGPAPLDPLDHASDGWKYDRFDQFDTIPSASADRQPALVLVADVLLCSCAVLASLHLFHTQYKWPRQDQRLSKALRGGKVRVPHPIVAASRLSQLQRLLPTPDRRRCSSTAVAGALAALLVVAAALLVAPNVDCLKRLVLPNLAVFVVFTGCQYVVAKWVDWSQVENQENQETKAW